jgi:hypothetical protein
MAIKSRRQYLEGVTFFLARHKLHASLHNNWHNLCLFMPAIRNARTWNAIFLAEGPPGEVTIDRLRAGFFSCGHFFIASYYPFDRSMII